MLGSISAPAKNTFFYAVSQTETSITLQWNNVRNRSYIVQFDGEQILIPASEGTGPVNYVVSNLNAGTRYTFSLFTVLENVSSSGVTVTAVTG